MAIRLKRPPALSVRQCEQRAFRGTMNHTGSIHIMGKSDLTQLLVSVRNADEAAVVSRNPVAILDVKEPDRGALGAPDAMTLRRISHVVPKNQTISFAIGELAGWRSMDGDLNENSLCQRYGQLLKDFQYVKLGLAGVLFQENWRLDWQLLFRNLPIGTCPVTVAYFDHQECHAPSPKSLIEFASSQHNCSTILFDTHDKTRNLFAYLSDQDLIALLRDAKRAGLQTVVAGSVDQSCLDQVLAAKPDFVGVRGAVCRGNRNRPIEGRLVSELAMRLQPSTQFWSDDSEKS